jgi:hypothetical protein
MFIAVTIRINGKVRPRTEYGYSPRVYGLLGLYPSSLAFLAFPFGWWIFCLGDSKSKKAGFRWRKN